jgi:plasmid replication initiation protein
MIAEVKNEDEDFKPYRFKVSELEKKMGKQLNRNTIKLIADGISRKPIRIDKGKGSFLTIGWVSSFEYYAKTGEMELCFDPKLKPYLLQLSSHFAKADIRQIFQLTSEYAKRIYTIFKQWQKVGKYTVEVAEWQKILEVPKSMNSYSNFKLKVLEPSKEQINKNTDLNVEYKEIKTGRKITHIEWTIEKKNGKQLTIEDVSKEVIQTGRTNEPKEERKVLSIRLESFLVHIEAQLKGMIGMSDKERRTETIKIFQYHGEEWDEEVLKEVIKRSKI